MITAYNQDGEILGRYDTATDLWYDYPDAQVKGGRAIVREPSGSFFFIFMNG